MVLDVTFLNMGVLYITEDDVADFVMERLLSDMGVVDRIVIMLEKLEVIEHQVELMQGCSDFDEIVINAIDDYWEIVNNDMYTPMWLYRKQAARFVYDVRL
jgi:hypothetical protein